MIWWQLVLLIVGGYTVAALVTYRLYAYCCIVAYIKDNPSSSGEDARKYMLRNDSPQVVAIVWPVALLLFSVASVYALLRNPLDWFGRFLSCSKPGRADRRRKEKKIKEEATKVDWIEEKLQIRESDRG